MARRHVPPAVRHDYTLYRNCLRWDFGFTCAACLLHERDWAFYGAEGLGITQIEHIRPQSTDPALIAVYSNLLYLCRYCNGARSDAPILGTHGEHLLDPTVEAWGAHFDVVGDQILPKPGDTDAIYTEDIYNINDPRKVMLRRRRRESLTTLLSLLAKGADLNTMGVEAAAARAFLEEALADILGRIRDYGPTPSDAPSRCRCARADLLALPASLADQVLDVGSTVRAVEAALSAPRS